MIKRYTREEMNEIWTDEYKFEKMKNVEVAVIEARKEYGDLKLDVEIPEIKVDVKEIEKIEKRIKHDVLAFVRATATQLPEELKKEWHSGLTSYDPQDTSLSLRAKKSFKIIEKDLLALLEALKEKALQYKYTPQIGRTHGQHAEPITFGFKLLNWYAEIRRHLKYLRLIAEEASVGKISGAVGVYTLPPQIEEMVCQKLGLRPAEITTQIISRDIHAYCLFILAQIATSLEKFATNIRNLSRPEIAEVMEGFPPEKKGSSAMPHKKNPDGCENICSLARLVRSYLIPALENNAVMWEERSLDNSANERITIPDAFILTDYMLVRFTEIIKNLVVDEERMLENINLSKGAVFSQRLMLALTKKGLPREEAHDLVQKLVDFSRSSEEKLSTIIQHWDVFKDYCPVKIDFLTLFTPQEIKEIFSLQNHLRHINYIFEKVLGRKNASN